MTINWVPYDFRHTFATRIALGGKEGGVDLVTLAALLGHEGIRVVQKYIHPGAQHKKDAMAKYERLLKEVEEAQYPESK